MQQWHNIYCFFQQQFGHGFICIYLFCPTNTMVCILAPCVLILDNLQSNIVYSFDKEMVLCIFHYS